VLCATLYNLRTQDQTVLDHNIDIIPTKNLALCLINLDQFVFFPFAHNAPAFLFFYHTPGTGLLRYNFIVGIFSSQQRAFNRRIRCVTDHDPPHNFLPVIVLVWDSHLSLPVQLNQSVLDH
jgi:hypothetical protein